MNSCIHACKTIVQMCEEARAMGKKHIRINKIENLADQAVQEDLSEERNKHSNWHTGTPTEEGWYLLKLVDEYGRITYDANYLRKGKKGMEWKYAFFGHVIIKWQKINEGEKNNGSDN